MGNVGSSERIKVIITKNLKDGGCVEHTIIYPIEDQHDESISFVRNFVQSPVDPNNPKIIDRIKFVLEKGNYYDPSEDVVIKTIDEAKTIIKVTASDKVVNLSKVWRNIKEYAGVKSGSSAEIEPPDVVMGPILVKEFMIGVEFCDYPKHFASLTKSDCARLFGSHLVLLFSTFHAKFEKITFVDGYMPEAHQKIITDIVNNYKV